MNILRTHNKKSNIPTKLVLIGVKIVNIRNTTILKRKSKKDIITELYTTTSLGNLILRIIPALLIIEVRPINTASLNRFIMMIPNKRPIL
jgi:hypothetical protein